MAITPSPREQVHPSSEILSTTAGGIDFELVPFTNDESPSDLQLIEDLDTYVQEYPHQASMRWTSGDQDAHIDSLLSSEAAYAIRHEGKFIGLFEIHSGTRSDGEEIKEVSTVIHPNIYTIEDVDLAAVSGELFAGVLSATLPGETVYSRVDPKNIGSLMLVTGLVHEIGNASNDADYERILKQRNPYVGARGFNVSFEGVTGINGSNIYSIKVPEKSGQLR